MFGKAKPRAFAGFIAEHGEEKPMELLEKNEGPALCTITRAHIAGITISPTKTKSGGCC